VLCLYSDEGPVVARYLDAGSDVLADRLRAALDVPADAPRDFAQTLTPAQAPRAEAACRDIVARIADDIRLSLTFYRTEYDRESVPRYAIAGALPLLAIPRWIADRLGLAAALEVLDPFRAAGAVEGDLATSGPEFLQAFGLALRAL
jgi:Tfp pilus assembly PilM family ATPase